MSQQVRKTPPLNIMNMEDYEQKTSWLTWLLGGLSAVLLAVGIYYWNGNKTLTWQNDRAERRADSLLSARLQLETDLSTLNDQLVTTKVDNTDLNKRIEAANQRLVQNDARLRELRRSNTGRVQAIQVLTQRLTQNLATLTTERDSLGNQMGAMQNKIGWMTDSSAVYQSRNEQLGREVTQLNGTLLTMVPRSALTGDGFRVETVKGNEKETAKAKKVDALLVSFNVPAELRLTGEQEVYLSLTDEQRNGMMPALRTAIINRPGLNEEISVHAVQTVNFVQTPQRISFTIDPVSTIKPGVYRASVYTKNAYLGATEFRLRDSFWFF